MDAFRRLPWPLLLSLPVVLARFFPRPALLDARTGAAASHAVLLFPAGHLLLTPLSILADWLNCNSLGQDAAFLAWVLLAYLVLLWRLGSSHPAPRGGAREREASPWRRILLLSALYWLGAASFIAWTLFFPRATARIALDDPNLLAVDFHSHSSYSWDGVKFFTPARNIAWHRSCGFGAAFITDHKTIAGARAAFGLYAGSPPYASLEGEELQEEGLHVVILGTPPPVDPDAVGLAELIRLVAPASRKPGGTRKSSAGSGFGRGGGRNSIFFCAPEDWKRYAPETPARLAALGTPGFEIFNTAPKPRGYPKTLERSIVGLARRKNLYLVADSDNHGYGYASCAWNVLRLPGWSSLAAPDLQGRILLKLHADGFNAVEPVIRNHPALRGASLLAEPWLSLWTLLRTFSAAQSLAMLAWIWGLWGLTAGVMRHSSLTSC